MQSIVNKLRQINYTFIRKPLVVGNVALQHHGIKKYSYDLDLVVSLEDWLILKRIYTPNIKVSNSELDIDATINLEDFNITLVKTIYQHNYDDLCDNFTEILKDYKIIGLEKLLFLKTLDAVHKKNLQSINDQKLIVDNIIKNKYA